MGLLPATCISCNKGFMWFTGNRIQACGECMPDIIVEETVTLQPDSNPSAITQTTIAWARIRDLLQEANAALFRASQIARLELNNDDFHRELYKHRVDMQFSNMRVRNALKHDRSASPFFRTVSDLEAEFKKGEQNEKKETGST